MQFIDLSVTTEPSVSEPVPVEIEYVSYGAGADILGRAGGLTRADFPDEAGLTIEHVKITSHSGTHVDAPSHFGPTTAGRRARNIDEMPLEWFFGPGVLLDCSVGDGAISADEIAAELARISHVLSPHEIVLINSGAAKLWGAASYFTDFRGMSREATAYLVERGVRVIGIDSFGFDRPFHQMLQSYNEGGGQGALWPAHFYGREHEYCHIERLANLEGIGRSSGFTVACFPVKLKGAGAGWTRVVAILDGDDER